MGLTELLRGLNAGVQGAGAFASEYRRLGDLDRQRQIQDEQRQIQRMGLLQRIGQQRLAAGDYAGANAMLPSYLESANSVLGENRVGPKYEEKPAAPVKAPSGGLMSLINPDLSPVMAPTFSVPSNVAALDKAFAYKPAPPKLIETTAGASLFDPQAGKFVGTAPVKPSTATPKYVEDYNPDGTFTLKPKQPGAVYHSKPAKQTAPKTLTDAQLLEQATKQWGRPKPVDNHTEPMSLEPIEGESEASRAVRLLTTNNSKQSGPDGIADGSDGVPIRQAMEAWLQGRDTIYEELKRQRDAGQMQTGREDPFNPPSSVSRGGAGGGNYGQAVASAASHYGVPPEIAQAVMMAESGGNPDARSPVGAVGLMQLMPETARGLGVDPSDPLQNIDGGVRYLKAMFDKFGSWDKALAAYNAGPGAVEKYGGVPPFAETQGYVRRILGSQQQSAAPMDPQLAAFYQKHGITPGGGNA